MFHIMIKISVFLRKTSPMSHLKLAFNEVAYFLVYISFGLRLAVCRNAHFMTLNQELGQLKGGHTSVLLPLLKLEVMIF